MASIKLAYGSPVSLTITNANLASSATAGWQSDIQDNTSNLYLDALVQCDFAAVNTAPGGYQVIYIFGFGCADGSGSNLTSTGSGIPSGSEGTLTYPDITTNSLVCPVVGTIPYWTQNKRLISSCFSIAQVFGGILPAKYAIGMVNYSGMTLNVNSIKIIPVYNTVA